MKRIACLTALSALVIAMLGAPALARGNDSRIELNAVAGKTDGSDPRYGETVTFTVSNPKTPRPEVRLVCGRDSMYYPPKDVVLDETLPYYGDGPREFVLASDAWTSGPNTCVAWLMRKGEPAVGTLFWVSG